MALWLLPRRLDQPHRWPGTEKSLGRLGRLFFSYPLPSEIRGEFARTDTKDGRRTIKGAFYRLAEKSAHQAFVWIEDGNLG